MTKRFGFTLAEVLITLGIIGVVAAMTMPTLMNQTNGLQYKTAYKKALSAISQAIVLNVALDEWNLADATATTTGADDLSIYSMLSKRMNTADRKTDGLGYNWTQLSDRTGSTYSAAAADASTNYALFFNDGIAFSFPNTAAQCSTDSTRGAGASGTTTTVGLCKGIIDVNGQKTPNREVKCDSYANDVCTVTNPSDIYPVVFFDQTIIPNSPAARAVLYAK